MRVRRACDPAIKCYGLIYPAILNLDERVPSDGLKVVGKGTSEADQAKKVARSLGKHLSEG